MNHTTDLNIYDADDQPTTCPRCGARTNFIQLLPGRQFHACRNAQCSYRFPIRDAEIVATFESALLNVVDYLWHDEVRHFADDCSQDHIFRQLVILRNWIEKDTLTAEEYAVEYLDQ